MPGCTVWLTGLSGSGKTTLATNIKAQLMYDEGYILDGDTLRMGLNSDLGFSPQDRKENIRRAAEVAAILNDSNKIVLCSFINPYEQDRKMCRWVHEKYQLEYVEIFVNASLLVCEQRDPKGLYKKARAGIIKDFTGVSAPYEPPVSPDLILDTESWTIEECTDACIELLKRKGIL